jgi:Cu/Ag efflux protein CusF
MMQKTIAVVSLAIATAFSAPAWAQTATGVVGTGPGVAGAARTVEVTATITAIDAATRAVTLKGPQGNEKTMTAGPEVKNFAQLKVGDTVDVSYAEALTLELKKGGGLVVGRTEQAGTAAAKPGEKPGAVAGRKVTMVGDVIAIDAATQVVTVKGAQRTVELKVQDPAQLKLIAKGDQVEATYTEAIAVVVRPAAKK